jgi:hypothetical protein
MTGYSWVRQTNTSTMRTVQLLDETDWRAPGIQNDGRGRLVGLPRSQWEHRNSILHNRDSTKQHTLITKDTDRLISRTDRLISRQFAMGIQGLPSKDHYLFQEPMGELLEAPPHVRKQWLASDQPARERQQHASREVSRGTPIHDKLASPRDWVIPSIWYFQSSVHYRRCVVPAPYVQT